MTAHRTPGEVLRAARQHDSQTKRTRVIATIDRLAAGDQRITAAAVARAAAVSKWLVYSDGIRDHLEAARHQQAQRHATPTPSRTTAASLRTDLELARADNRRLRDERDQLRTALRHNLGHQLDQVAASDLVARVDELVAENTTLTTRNSELERRLAQAQDDLTAARTSLRQMIRAENR